MSLPAFFPNVQYVHAIPRDKAITLESLCDRAGARCEAFGRWTQRPVVLVKAETRKPWLKAEPGGWGAVEIGVPPLGSAIKEARWALGAMAYVLFDGVARATVLGKDWARVEKPKGRASTRRPLTNAERQQRFRERKMASGILSIRKQK